MTKESMRAAARMAVAGVALSCIALGAASAQLEAGMALDVVPAEARALAAQAAPDAEFYEASMEVVDELGHATVEIAGRDPEGRHVEVDLFQDGQTWIVDEIERHISWDETPAVVKAGVARMYTDDWRPTVIERSQRANGEVVFEIEGIDRYDERVELEVNAAGEILSLAKFNAS